MPCWLASMVLLCDHGELIFGTKFLATKQLDVFLKPYDVIDVSETGIFNGKPWMDLVISALVDGMRNNLSRPMIW